MYDLGKKPVPPAETKKDSKQADDDKATIEGNETKEVVQEVTKEVMASFAGKSREVTGRACSVWCAGAGGGAGRPEEVGGGAGEEAD